MNWPRKPSAWIFLAIYHWNIAIIFCNYSFRWLEMFLLVSQQFVPRLPYEDILAFPVASYGYQKILMGGCAL